MDNLNMQETFDATKIFGSDYLDGKALYLYFFKRLPSVRYIGSIDGEKAFNAFREKFGSDTRETYSYKYFDKQKKQYVFGETYLLMQNDCLVEFDDYYCEILYTGEPEAFIEEVTRLVKPYRQRARRKPLEINLVSRGKNGLDLKGVEVKRTKLQLDLFYEDDFKEIDEVIRTRLNRKNDKGIVLLHGLPGTGKTSYIRYLVGKIKKRVMFLSPNLAGSLSSPDFIDLLISNPNTVIIIEDAENIVMDRKVTGDSTVSDLLNISDGLLADFLNVQLICTFNSSLTLVDSALMRKGRLIAKYEFGKLSVNKAQRLSDHLGFHKRIERPMTVAEVANQDQPGFEQKSVQIMGFRRDIIEN